MRRFLRALAASGLLAFLACSAQAQTGQTLVWGVNSADQIWQYQGNGQWRQVPGGLSHVSVGTDGTVWGVNRAGEVYSRTGETWTRMPGGLAQVSVGTATNVWGVNAGDEIWRWDGARWIGIPGRLRHVSVGSDGTVWGVNRAGEVYSRTGESWTRMPGGLVQVAVGTATNVWGVNAGDEIWRWDGARWIGVPGRLMHVSVAGNGAVWGVNRAGAIFTRNGDNWTQIPGGLVQVSAASPAMVPIIIPPTNLNIPAPATTTSSGAVPGPITIQGGTQIIVDPSFNPNAPVPVQQQPQLQVVSGSAIATYRVGAVGTSSAECGASPKPLCSPGPALFEGNASNACPAGSFMDVGKWSCWSCPAGYERSAAAVDTERACQQRNASQAHAWSPSTFRGHLCPEGSFHDPIRGGECWSCPPGFSRSLAHVEAANACWIPMGERFANAQRVKNTIWPHECAAGSFHDIYAGGGCWTCPANYRRTAYHVAASNACVQTVNEQQARAKIVQKAQCGPGEFFDMKIPGTQNTARGGACYTCPVAYDRTVHPVDSPQACEHAPGWTYARATQVRTMTCPTDQFFDPINSNDANVRNALNARNLREPGSQVVPAGAGGSCWKCPPGWKRSIGAVYGSQACLPPTLVWKPAPYNQPGLFGLRGAEAVALRLVQDRTAINAIIGGIQATATPGSLSPTFARDTWEQIATSPQSSPVLKAAVWSRVVAAATNPATATPDEIALRDDAVEQVRLFRVYMAQNALDAYQAWKANERYRSGMYAQSQLQVMTDLGEIPPDYEDITAQTIVGSMAASGAASTAIALALTPEAVRKFLFPYAFKATYQMAKPVANTARLSAQVGRAVGEAAKTGVQAAGGISAMAASIGPQIIVTFAIEVLAVAIEQQIEKSNAEPKLLAGLGAAQNTRVDFGRLTSTEAGRSQAEGYWSQLMGGPATVNNVRPADIGPVNLMSFTTAARAAQAAL